MAMLRERDHCATVVAEQEKLRLKHQINKTYEIMEEISAKIETFIELLTLKKLQKQNFISIRKEKLII
jgi:hypothetical protein